MVLHALPRLVACLLACFLALPAAGQSPAATCAEAARALVEGARPSVETRGRLHSEGGSTELRWSTAEGHEGSCRVDAWGRVVSVAIERFPEAPGASYALTCSSTGYRREECRLRGAPAQVRLLEQLSRSRCIEGTSWGVAGDRLWVDQGCSGRFEVRARPRFEPYDLACESRNDRRQVCALKGPAEASLVRQLSRSRCIEGRSWGVEGEELWVDEGCRAIFRIEPAGDLRPDRGARERAREACHALARTQGLRVLEATVRVQDRSRVELDLEVERRGVRMDLTCRYEIATDRAVLLDR